MRSRGSRPRRSAVRWSWPISGWRPGPAWTRSGPDLDGGGAAGDGLEAADLVGGGGPDGARGHRGLVVPAAAWGLSALSCAGVSAGPALAQGTCAADPARRHRTRGPPPEPLSLPPPRSSPP